MHRGFVMDTSATFKREIASLAGVFGLVELFFRDGEINPDMRFPIDLALEEVFTNMVKYNAAGRSEIIVGLSLEDGELRMTLIDSDSGPFDLTTQSPKVDIDKPLLERTKGKLGVHLVKEMMDRVEYEHHDRTATITLYKRVG